MSFDSYYEKNKKKNTATSTKNGGGSFDNYYEAYKKNSPAASKSEGGSFDKYYSNYQDNKSKWEQLDTQTSNPMFAQDMDTTWQNLSSSPEKKAFEVNKKAEATKDTTADAKTTVNPNKMISTGNIYQDVAANLAADMVGKTDNVKQAATAGAKTIGQNIKDFTTGVAQGFTSGALKFGKAVYDNLSPKSSKNMAIDGFTDLEGNKIEGQEWVNALNEMNKGRGDNLTYALDEKGKIIATDDFNRLLDKGINHLSINENDTTAKKVGGTVGDVINQVGQMGTIGNITGGINPTGSHLLNKMIQGGLTGSTNSMLNSEINNEDLESTAKNALRSGLFFAAGSGASEVAGNAMTNFLTNKGLQNSIPAYVGEQVLKGAAFSGAGELAQLPTYPLLGDEMPSMKQVATDIATGALYDLVGGIAQIPSLKKNSQAILNQVQGSIEKSGSLISQLEARGKGDVDTMNTLYDSLQTEIAKTQYELNNARLLGEDARVNEYSKVLNNISNDLKERQAPYLSAKKGRDAAGTTKIGASDTGLSAASSSSTNNAPMLMNDTKGVMTGKPYTNIQNGVIQQTGNAAKYLPESTQGGAEQAKVVEPINSTTKAQDTLQAKISANNGSKNTITIERLNQDTQKFEEVTFKKGEMVRVHLGKDSKGESKFAVDKINGIRHINGKAYMVNESGTLIDEGHIYKYNASVAPSNTSKVESTVSLNDSITRANKGNETTFTEADRVPEVDTYDFNKSADVTKRMRSGEATLQEVKGAYQYTVTFESEIKAEANKLTAAELRKKVNTFDTSSMKKADLVDKYYEDRVADFIYALSGKSSIETRWDFSNPENTTLNQYKKQSKNLVDTVSEQQFEELATKRKQKVAENRQRQEAALKSVKEPTTLEDYNLARRYRSLTTTEQRGYERLKAQSEKQALRESKIEKQVSVKTEAAGQLPGYSVSEDVHSKTNEKLYVLKFNDRMDADTFKQASSYVKENGGYWSKFKKGFIFKEYPNFKSEDTQLETVKEEAAVSTQSQKLSTMADKMQTSIDNYRGERLENTAKRQREAASAREEADRLEQKQTIIRKISDKAEAGELEYLDNLTAMTQFDTLDKVSRRAYYQAVNSAEKTKNAYLSKSEEAKISRMDAVDNAVMPLENLYKEHLVRFAEDAQKANTPGTKQAAAQLLKYLKSQKGEYVSLKETQVSQIETILSKPGSEKLIRSEIVKDDLAEQRRLNKMGISSNEMLRETLRELETIRTESVITKTPEQVKAEKLKVLENEAANSKISGYFPTPKKIVDQMIEIADIQEGDKVLEPSAGTGDIADSVGVGKVDVVEYSGLLRDILKEKGHTVVGSDALEVTGTYDKIVMNPPFEKNQDIDHVTHAFNENLNSGGRLVAITSSHFTFANDKKSQAFRELVKANGYYENLPEGSFKESRRSTGVNTCLVVLEKEGTSSGIYVKNDDGTYEKGTVTYEDDFGAYYEVEKADGTTVTVNADQVLSEESYKKESLSAKANQMIGVQKEAIETKKAMAEKSNEVVAFLKGQKDGKKPMSIYMSPELAGVDNIKSIGQYLKFTDNPKDYKLDTFQSELANTHPEVKDLGLEEFGTWLVDQVTTFRESKSLIDKAELSYKESFKLINVEAKAMQSVKQLEAAVAEIESNMRRFPLSLQFFAEQQIKQYKSLLKQLKSEGVTRETLDRVAMLQRELKGAQSALEREKVKSEEKLNKLIEKNKREKNTAVVKSEVKAALEKEALQEKAESKLNMQREKLEREKKTAVVKEQFAHALTKEKAAAKLEQVKGKDALKLNDEKAKRAVDRFKNISKDNRKDLEKKIKELHAIAKERKFKMEPEVKEAVTSIISDLEGKTISVKSEKALTKLENALTRMKAYEDTPGLSDGMKERIANIKEINTDLTYEDFIDIYNSVQVLVHQNKMQNKLMTAERYHTINDAVVEFKSMAVKKVRKSGRGIKVEKSGVTRSRNRVDDKVYLPQLQIKNLCAKLEGTQGGVLREILYTNIVKGHTVKYDYLKRSMDYFSKELESVDMKAIDNGTYTLDVNDQEQLTITSIEKIALALNSYNDKNRYSVVEGGFARNNNDTVYRISDNALDQLVLNLTGHEKKIVDTVLTYFETLNQEQINGVTLKMFNYEGAKEKFYYPKKVVKSKVRINESQSLEEASGLGHMQAGNLENAGFLKPKTKTKTPVRLMNPFEVVIQMMNDTAELSAYAPALRDARIMLKKLEPFIKENYSDTMYKQLADYVTSMNKPNNMQNESDKVLNTLYNNTVTAIFGLNVSTAAKQPLGLINTATEIEGKYLLKAMTKLPGTMGSKKAIIEKYAPYLWYRAQGNINRDLSETNMKKSVDKTFYGKKTLRDYATTHITQTDMYVAYRIWEASENKVAATTNLKPGSEEFYNAVGEMATEITLTTQGNGEVTHRSQIMRGDNVWKKSFTAFQQQAQICFNQLDMAYEEFKETVNIGQFTRKALLISLIPVIANIGVGEVVKYLQGNKNSLLVKKQQAIQTGIGDEAITEEFFKRVLGELASTNLYTGIAYDAIESASNIYGADSNNPMYRELQNLAKGVSYLKSRKTEEAFSTISESLLKLTSMPVDNAKKLGQTAAAISSGYDYSLSDEEVFKSYNKAVNKFEYQAKKNSTVLTPEQQETVSIIDRYNRSINQINSVLEDEELGLTEEEIKQLQSEKEEMIKAANTYFNANKNRLK